MALNGKEMVKYDTVINTLSLRGFLRYELILFFSIISQVSFSKKDEEFKFSKEFLIELTGWDKNNKQRFSKTLESLCYKLSDMKSKVKTKNKFGYINLFEYAIFDDETEELDVMLTSTGLKLLTNLLKNGKWALWELEEYASYKSTYTMEFFRRMREYTCTDKATGKYWWAVSLEEFKELMGIPETFSAGNIKQKVLDVIMKELADKYQLEIVTKKKWGITGRPTITGYKFYFKFKKYTFNDTKQMEDVTKSVEQQVITTGSIAKKSFDKKKATVTKPVVVTPTENNDIEISDEIRNKLKELSKINREGDLNGNK